MKGIRVGCNINEHTTLVRQGVRQVWVVVFLMFVLLCTKAIYRSTPWLAITCKYIASCPNLKGWTMNLPDA